MRSRKSNFTFMVAAQKGIGKSTFINTLPSRNIVCAANSDEINMYMLDADCEGVSRPITAIDTPGFGYTIKDDGIMENIVNFIKMQFDKYLSEETKVCRDPNFEDTRIHCLIYFIPPCRVGLKEKDIEFLKLASPLVNIIPVIGKADALTEVELKETRAKIKEQMLAHKINLFNLEGTDKLQYKNVLEGKIPFGLICAVERFRSYRWGKAETDSYEHCDFGLLKEVLMSSHYSFLMDTTDYGLYEKYRTEVLSSMMQGKQ